MWALFKKVMMDAYHEMKSLVYIKAKSDTLQTFWDFCTTRLYSYTFCLSISQGIVYDLTDKSICNCLRQSFLI